MNFSKLSKVAACAVFVAVFVSSAHSANVLKSGPTRVALVELYTSEGCSSCPPAEIWFGGLKDSSNLWLKFVPVSFHVDYWDRLGWPDPLASEKFTARQYLYAQKWDSRAVYTPGFVLNGKEWRQWSSGLEPPSELSEPAGELEVEMVGDNKFRISFSPVKNDAPKWQASAALLGFEIMSPVKEGENKGKTLEHNFSVVGFSQGTMKKEGNRFSIELTVKNDVMLKPKRLGVAVWVTTDGITPVQAVGGYLD
jgi:hypothetical protein